MFALPKQAVTSINNVIMGKLYLDHKGAYTVQCLGSGGLCARMKFHASSMLTSKAKLHEVGVYSSIAVSSH